MNVKKSINGKRKKGRRKKERLGEQELMRAQFLGQLLCKGHRLNVST